MAGPYESVAEVYDIMVDWPARIARERPFFDELIRQHPVRKVLDVGCGTGHHARLFAEMGIDTIGLEPSEQMIRRARALTTGPNPSFIQGGFEDIAIIPGSFDLMTVLGNTLPHARDDRELRTALGSMHDKLYPAGRIVIQVINYDRLLAEGAHRLAPVHRKVKDHEYVFLREYRSLTDKAEFTITTITCDGKEQRHTERTEHLPLTSETLQQALHHAGFTDITLYGTFERDPFDEQTSPGLIAIAVKG